MTIAHRYRIGQNDWFCILRNYGSSPHPFPLIVDHCIAESKPKMHDGEVLLPVEIFWLRFRHCCLIAPRRVGASDTESICSKECF
jgi:hypothetical protein